MIILQKRCTAHFPLLSCKLQAMMKFLLLLLNLVGLLEFYVVSALDNILVCSKFLLCHEWILQMISMNMLLEYKCMRQVEGSKLLEYKVSWQNVCTFSITGPTPGKKGKKSSLTKNKHLNFLKTFQNIGKVTFFFEILSVFLVGLFCALSHQL